MKRISLIPALLALSLAVGCAGSFGFVRADSDVAAMFEGGRLPADHSYYYAGSDSGPDALIGIAPGYTLKSRLWRPVNLDEAAISALVRNMTGGLGTGTAVWGAELLDRDGRRVGIWYSPHQASAVAVGPGGEVFVNPPRPKILDGGASPFSPMNRELYSPGFPRVPNR